MNSKLPTFLIILALIQLTLGQGLCPTVYSSWSFSYKDTRMPIIMKFQKYRTSASVYECAHLWVIDCECFTIQRRYIASPNTKISHANIQDEGWAAIWKFPGADSSSSNLQALKWKDSDECQTRDIKEQYLAFAHKIDIFDSYRFVSAKELELGVTEKGPKPTVTSVGKLLR